MKLHRPEEENLARNFAEIEDRLNLGPEVLDKAPPSPAFGRTYMDSTLKKMRTWDGTQWQNHW